MVTSIKQSDKKIVKMADQGSGAVMPQRTLLGEVNEHITCSLCRGYYIDATTIVECLHSFCRSCIIKHLQNKSYCPVCEMMINSAKPNIKPDKALQDIVYKLVPGLFQKEMERRQQFYSSRPGPAATATPEQRGEDTERIIFSPEDVISFSLEYADATDTDSISSKSSDSNESQPQSANTRRYLQCPAVVNISHLKKFLSMKFDIDSTQFAIDILYKRVPLPDYYTLMDIAYIYNWKRNEPMRFFYQIIDYVAIRNRLFDINRKGSHFRDRKSSPALTEDTNVSSPAQNLIEQGSEASSGTNSPMPDDNSLKKISDGSKINDKLSQPININTQHKNTLSKKTDDEVEKSQFLNSFELTAKLTSQPPKCTSNEKCIPAESMSQTVANTSKSVVSTTDSLKRKGESNLENPEIKKIKYELEKPKSLSITSNNNVKESPSISNQFQIAVPTKNTDTPNKNQQTLSVHSTLSSTSTKDKQMPSVIGMKHVTDNPVFKRSVIEQQNISSSKKKPDNPPNAQLSSGTPKTVSPLKLQIPRLDGQKFGPKSTEPPKQSIKKLPDLKPTIPSSTMLHNKIQPMNKVRMDLLANNSDPTIDRSKILSQVNSSLSGLNPGQTSGDPLKSLFDSCKINIPSSLSITLTDQKLDCRNPGDVATTDQNKSVLNKNLAGASNSITHKVPSPPVHNYIEILKLPESDPKSKQQNKIELNNPDIKPNQIKSDMPAPQLPHTPKSTNKTSEISAKGPVPNLKPIADTKLVKHTQTQASSSTQSAGPITFQQTFEQQLQSMHTEKKAKLLKLKAQVPKLVPATAKVFSAANKLPNMKPSPFETKTSTALDLSTHNVRSQLGPQQAKAFEIMQSIISLAKKQNLPAKSSMPNVPQSN